MPYLFENYGLEDLVETQENLTNLMRYIAQDGRMIRGYYDTPYLYKALGDLDLFMNTENGEGNTLRTAEVSIHCGGSHIWDLIYTGFNLTPPGHSHLEKVLLCRNAGSEGGVVPIHIATADVLPSFMAGDHYRIQVVAQPIQISYYKDFESYEESQPKDPEGKRLLVGKDRQLAIQFLVNHQLTDDMEKVRENEESDSFVHFCATVTRVRYGTVSVSGSNEKRFIRVFAKTQFGELEFDHSLLQVPEEQFGLLKAGSVISGVCVISGDAAIGEYENGIILDKEHDLRLLNYVLSGGDPERLRTVLSEDCRYESESSGVTQYGPEEIISWMRYVKENSTKRCTGTLATITNADGLSYPVGTRCAALSYEGEGITSIVFIDVDGNGLIRRILVSSDSRFQFRTDSEEEGKAFLKEITDTKNVSERMFKRCQYLDLIPFDERFQDVMKPGLDEALLQEKARHALSELTEIPLSEVHEEVISCLGFLFADAMRETAEAGRQLTSEERIRMEKAMELGKQFYNDFYTAVMEEGLTEEDRRQILLEAAVAVQRLGKFSAVRYLRI